MTNLDKITVFLDTSVLLPAFVSHRKGYTLPLYMNDTESARFTFEKCIYESYMAFRGVGGKKPSEGRGDWANRFLKNKNDPKSLDKLASKFHGDSMEYAFFWANNIQSVIPANYDEAMSQLEQQRGFFEMLCDDFWRMLVENNITILWYSQVFSDNNTWIEKLGLRPSNLVSPALLDGFVRATVIPSEDFENVFAASRINTDIFLTDDNQLIRCSWSLGTNSSPSAGSFCRSDEYETKKQEYLV